MANNFGLIQANTVVEVFDTNPDINADVRDISQVAGCDVGWWIDGNGVYHPPTGYTWEDAQTAAANELNQTMNICVRCLERQQPVPDEWISYRDTLRATRDATSGDPTASFPPRPAYPPGIDPPPGYPPGEVVWPPPSTAAVAYILPGGASTGTANYPTVDLPVPGAPASGNGQHVAARTSSPPAGPIPRPPFRKFGMG